ncbi:MAG: serine protein kinase PrkA [Candidatus Nanohaloarchaea archaeon]|nr:serine protein kinase PrkA [Candidatus Nanohaloarchaea archaeon]
MTQTMEELLDGAPDRPEKNETLDFNEYLNEVYDDPKVERNAYQRLVDSLEYWGVEEDPEHGRNLYNLFTEDPINDGQDVFYGENIHGRGGEDGEGIDKLADRLYNAAEKKGSHKRLLVMLGPVGAGKTDVSKKLVEGFEEYTQTEEGRMYTWEWQNLADRVPGQHPDDDNIDAPMQQSPLLLLPDEKREDVVEELNERLDASYTLDLDQNLTPESEFYRDKLVEHYIEEADGEMNEYEALQEVLDNHIEVKPLVADENKGQAVATFEPKKPKNQDEKDLTGGTDLSRVGNYGEGDPRAFEYSGALNKANRGIFSGEELLKLDTEFLYNFLEATEDSTIKPKGQPLIDMDVALLGRTNMAEFKEKQDTEKMEAFSSRMNRIDFPYIIEYGDESKIYEKFVRNSDGDIALEDEEFDPEEHDVNLEPHTLEMASMFSVATRIEDPKHGDEVEDLIEKVQAYNGDLDDVDVKKLRENGKEQSEHGEGMKGITTRYIEDQVFAAMRDSEKRGEQHVSPLKVLSYLENNLEENASILDSEHDELKGLVGNIREEVYKERAVEDVRHAMAYDENELEQMAEKYLKHANAYVRGKDEVEGGSSSLTDRQDVDTDFLEEVEEQLDFRSDNAEDFRNEIDSWISGRTLEGEDFTPLDNNRLREAVQKKLWEDKKDHVNFPALVNESESLEDDTRNATLSSLQDLGYSEDGAEEVLEYVGSEVARSELEEL